MAMSRGIWGSSPRVWGQGKALKRTPASSRIIPTRVGTSENDRCKRSNDKDHPHACGDKNKMFGLDIWYQGSSPRGWGQVCTHICPCRLDIIIPTRVGTSTLNNPRTYTTRDHPHACGDKRQHFIFDKAFTGSSPRVWGQVESVEYKLTAYGIIPTRVGTSGTYRVCFKRTVGSSPRVWGQAIYWVETRIDNGIIPTRVGTRYPDGDWDSTHRDHPHACGDKNIVPRIISVTAGSSPRVWGQGGKTISESRYHRIIPTRVGTREELRNDLKKAGDHPHACGDKFFPRCSRMIC